MTDLSLRRPGGTDHPASDSTLIDNVLPMLERAAAIADLLFTVENSGDDCMDTTRAAASWAIVLEMDDARAEIEAWRKANIDAAAAEAKAKAEAEAKRLEDPKERLRDALRSILAPEFPDPKELEAEIDRRFAREEAREAKENKTKARNAAKGGRRG